MASHREPSSSNKKRAPLVYRNFDLRLANYAESKGIGTFKVWVEGDPPGGGAMSPDEAVERTYDPQAFWRYPTQGRGGLIGGVETRRTSRADLFKLGQVLGGLVLPPGRVRELFEQSRASLEQGGEGLRLRLRVDSSVLGQLPWEYMSLSHAAAEPAATDFLALRPGLSIVRKATVSSAYHPLPNRPLARVVGVLSSPEDQDPLDLWRDKAAIEKAVKNVNERTKRKTIELRWVETRATREAVTEALADGADIVHYGGHGVYDPDTDQGYILLETESGDGAGFSAEHLAALLLGSGVRLVVLGACETARRDGRNMWSGVAPALTRERVPAVIANQFDILDDSATLLAETLYPLLLGGHTVDEALSEARRAIYQSGTLEDRDWGSPVLYLHEETGVLFPLQKLDESGAARHSPFVHVALELGNIADEVIGVRARHLAAGKVDVNIKAGDVKKGGRVIGAEFGTISGPGGADATYLDDDDEDDV